MKLTSGKKAPKRGEVYWVCLDPVMGTEIQKTRPGVIISSDLFNKSLPRVIIAPITSNIKIVFDFQALISLEGKEGKVLLDQVRTVDKERLGKKIGSVNPREMASIENALKLTLEIN